MRKQKRRRRLLNVEGVGRGGANGFRLCDVAVGKLKLIGDGGPKVGEFAFAGGRRDGAVGAAVAAEVGELRVGAVTVLTHVRSVGGAVHVGVLLQGTRRAERLTARRACVTTNCYFRSLLR